MNGIELLRIVDKVIDNQELEDILGYQLQTELSVFFSLYQLGDEGFLNAKILWNEFPLPITFVHYKNMELEIDLRLSKFYSFESLKEIWSEEKQSKLYHDFNVLPLVFTEIKLDHIFINPKTGSLYYLLKEELKQIEKSVFTFCQKLTETEILDEDYKNKDLFKNWGEDFWRVKA